MPQSRRPSTIGPLSDEAIIQKHVEAAKKKKSPAAGATPSGFAATQATQPILNGRPFATGSSPVHIYNDVFTTFTTIYKDKTRAIPPNIQKRIFDLCHASSALYKGKGNKDEEGGGTKWVDTIIPIYRLMLNESILGFGSQGNGAIMTLMNDGQLALRGIIETTDEIGAGGCDPSLQGCLSYSRYWSRDGVRAFLTLSLSD